MLASSSVSVSSAQQGVGPGLVTWGVENIQGGWCPPGGQLGGTPVLPTARPLLPAQGTPALKCT